MQIARTNHDTDVTLTISGPIVGATVHDLRAQLEDVLNHTGRDIVLDVRQVEAFDDTALVALVVARSRAKYQRRRIVVVDGDGGAATASLRRSGLSFRFPIYPDVAAAVDGLSADRSARRGLVLSATAN